MSLLPASIKGSDQNQPRKGGDIVFPIINQWGLSVAMETRVLIRLHIKFYQDGQQALEIFKFESVDDDGRTIGLL